MALQDSVILAADPGFQGRCLEAFIAQSLEVLITADNKTTPRRVQFAVQVLNSPASFKELFAMACASDQSNGGIIYSATYGLEGAPATPTLTPQNVAAQAANILDSLITTWVTAYYNAFFTP